MPDITAYDAHAKFRDWCRQNGFPDLADQPEAQWQTYRLSKALELYDAEFASQAAQQDPTAPRPQDQTLEARVRSEFDRAAGTLSMMTKRLAIRVKDLKAKDGMTPAVRDFRDLVILMGETATEMINVVGGNRSMTVDKLLKEKNDDQHKPANKP